MGRGLGYKNRNSSVKRLPYALPACVSLFIIFVFIMANVGAFTEPHGIPSTTTPHRHL